MDKIRRYTPGQVERSGPLAWCAHADVAELEARVAELEGEVEGLVETTGLSVEARDKALARVAELKASHTKYVLERALVEVRLENRVLALETAGVDLLTASFDENGDEGTGTAVVRLGKVLGLEHVLDKSGEGGQSPR